MPDNTRSPLKFNLLIFALALFSIALTKNSAFAQTKSPPAKQIETVVSQTDNSPQESKQPIFEGQKVTDRAIVPPSNGEIITDIVVRFVDEEGNTVAGKTKPKIILQEFQLQPGDIYRANLAREGLEGVLDLVTVARASLHLVDVSANLGYPQVYPLGRADGGLSAEPVSAACMPRDCPVISQRSPKSKRAVMEIAVQENSNFSIGFGLTLPPPTALQGSVRPVTVEALSDSANGFTSGVRLGLLNLGGNNQGVSLGVEGGTQAFGFNLGYRKFIRHDRGFGVNFYNRRGVESEYENGDPDVDLDNGSDPWVHRLGGGVEYFSQIAPDWQGAVGVSYQRVSIRDGAFSDKIESRDSLGNRLTKSEDGQDDLLTLNFATVLNRRDSNINPTGGYRFKLSSDQYLPIGTTDVLANRLSANYTHYLPLPLFGFTQGAKTLVLNFQGGTILGDAVPYESFILGGSSSVRGYGSSEITTARSFIQATAEYRYPIFGVEVFKNQVDVGGTFFIDYASDLGTADAVIGRPAIVRDRPGSGLGYGLGLRAITPIGAVRTEFALNDLGEFKFIFKVGDRF